MHTRLGYVAALGLALCLDTLTLAGPQGQPAPADIYGDALPAGAVARLGTERLRPGRDPFALAFSADGQVLATAHSGGRVEFWDAATGKHRGRLTVPSGADLRSIAYSPDGKYLAAGAGDHHIWVWDLAAAKPPRPLKGHFASPSA